MYLGEAEEMTDSNHRNESNMATSTAVYNNSGEEGVAMAVYSNYGKRATGVRTVEATHENTMDALKQQTDTMPVHENTHK